MLEAVGKRCCGCAACYNICSENAINMAADAEGFLYPRINGDICIHCGRCEKVCPILNFGKDYNNTVNTAFACYGKDIDKRMHSASGAVFTLLAEKIIGLGGVVYGAAFDESLMVKHFVAHDLNELESLKGSKYIQSEIGKSYMLAKSDLASKKVVLFSGTPCEIEGLRGYLGKDYPNLICVDVFCHGVSSASVWQQYLRDKFIGEKVIQMRFRDKSKGMKNKFLTYTLDNGQKVLERYDDSPYMTGYTQNLFLRRSCYACPFKGNSRCSDLSIGDFWGLHKVIPAFGDDYGVSAVIVHTKKGAKIFCSIEDNMIWTEVEPERITSSNESYFKSAKYNDKREAFFSRIRNENMVDVLIEMYDPHFWDYLWQTEKASLFERVILKMKKLLG